MSNDNPVRIKAPLDIHLLLRKHKKLRRQLREKAAGAEIRLAVLGGSTTAEITNLIELFLLADGFRVKFWESDYNRFFEDAVFGNPELDDFGPQFVYVHTTNANIGEFPQPFASPRDTDIQLDAVYGRYEQVWQSLAERYGCDIVQNNFEPPYLRPLGQLDATASSGRTVFVNRLNDKLAAYARSHSNLHISDLHYLSSWIGLERWYDRRLSHSYKYAMSMDAMPSLALGVANIIRAALGRSKKCLVLDLDNTLWGGVVGDDGVEAIDLGNGTFAGEAYLELQQYVRDLRACGVILAVCSKNDEETARAGIGHPESRLRMEDFSSFKANWLEKSENIVDLSTEINIGLDSLVFLDDNPAEREIVSAQVPAVAVPCVGSDVVDFARIVDKAGFFDAVVQSNEDQQRQQFYADNQKRETQKAQFADYSSFLASLEMTAEFGRFVPEYMPRIAQLTNKTNQFNLTTKRFTQTEMEAFRDSDGYITLCGRLEDRFGNNGLVTVLLGRVDGEVLYIDLWLMSCRVIKRQLEWAALQELERSASEKGLRSLRGYYVPTKKNGLVKDHYRDLGFELVDSEDDGATTWSLDLETARVPRHIPIRVVRRGENVANEP